MVAEDVAVERLPTACGQTLCTPTTVVSSNGVRSRLDSSLGMLNDESGLYLQNLANAAGKVFADRDLLRLNARLLRRVR